ncbi:glycosyl hydrolase [Aspergillus carlsbadensis]|nr:glycosyl hydrolase [Aspergillus carlsbadensis]
MTNRSRRNRDFLCSVSSQDSVPLHDIFITPNDSKQNFIVSTHDIWTDDWSDPVYFDFDRIDPDLFFDNGKTYVAGSAPGSGINLIEIEIETGEKLSPERTIWTGSGDEHPEGPHIYQQKGFYYLMVAEGGTHEGHMVTMAREKEIWGHSTPDIAMYFRMDKDSGGGVCLGVRKDRKGQDPLGREIFLTRGDWTGDWLALQQVTTFTGRLAGAGQQARLSPAPNVGLVHIRDPDLVNDEMSDAGATAILPASAADLDNPRVSPTFTGKKQHVLTGHSEVILCRESEPRRTGAREGWPGLL